MLDMTSYITAKSDQLNSDDLAGPLTITITKVTASPDASEQPVSVHYEGDGNRPYKPCKTCRRIMVAIWGKDASKYVGRSMTLYRDPEVQFGGMKVGGIRISHMSHMDGDKTVALLVTRGRKAPFKVQPLKAAPQSEQTDAFGLKPVPEDTPKARQTPQEWTDGYLGKLAACETTEALMELQTKSAKGLAKLQADHPDLHELTVNADTKRATELQTDEFAE